MMRNSMSPYGGFSSPRQQGGSGTANGGGGLSSSSGGGGVALDLRESQRNILQSMIQSAVPIDTKYLQQQQQQSSSSSSFGGGSSSASEQQQSQWKILLYDTVGRDIIAPLLKVRELHDLGVTVHKMMTDAKRTAVPATPAVYLCAPTEANVEIIARDCGRQLYEWVYINFTAPCPRDVMEALAMQLALQLVGRSCRHIKVFDLSLSFATMAGDLYSLLLPQSFVTLNSRHTGDTAMEAHVEAIATGLSHVAQTKRTVPLVAFARGGPAQFVGQKLSQVLRDLHEEGAFGAGGKGTGSSSSSSAAPSAATAIGPGSSHRPLVLVVDRSADIAAALHHPFSYRGLLTDVLEMQLNKVRAATEDGPRQFDVDPVADAVYAHYAGCDFGEFGDHVAKAMATYQEEYQALTRQSGLDDTDKSGITEMLANAPRLRERKMFLEMHTLLAHVLLKKVREGELDKFHGVEAALLNKEGFDAAAFEELLTSPAPLLHKQRLFMVAFLLLADDEASLQNNVERLRFHVDGDDKPFPALQYLRRLRSWSVSAAGGAGGGRQQQQQQQAPAAALQAGFTFAQSLARTLANTFTAGHRSELPLTRLVDALALDPAMASSAARSAKAKVLEALGGVDPLTGRAASLADAHFADITVFVTGGGTVAEYDNLKAWEVAQNQQYAATAASSSAASTAGGAHGGMGGAGPRFRSVSYGSTSMITGNEMLQQLAVLGAE